MRLVERGEIGGPRGDAQVSKIEILCSERGDHHVVQRHTTRAWKTQAERVQAVIAIIIIAGVVGEVYLVAQREDTLIMPCGGCIDVDQTAS